MRYFLKKGLYSLITSADYNKAVEKELQSYHTVKAMQGGSRQSMNERRENADILAILILKAHLSSGQMQKFIDFFREHFYSYQSNMAQLKWQLCFEEQRWRANWFRIMGTLLENHYKA